MHPAWAECILPGQNAYCLLPIDIEYPHLLYPLIPLLTQNLSKIKFDLNQVPNPPFSKIQIWIAVFLRDESNGIIGFASNPIYDKFIFAIMGCKFIYTLDKPPKRPIC